MPTSAVNASTHRYIVRLPNHLGDACMTLPALELLAQERPLVLVGKPWIKKLFAAYETRGWQMRALSGRFFSDVSQLRALVAAQARHGARGILFTNSFGTALQFRLAGLAATGYAREWRRALLTQAVAVPHAWFTDMHVVQYYFELARQVVAPELARNAQPAQQLALAVTPAAVQQAQQLLKAAAVSGKYVVLCPVAVGLHYGRVKAWSGFGELCRLLQARGHQVVVCPGPGEAAAVKAATASAVMLPTTDVGSFAALLAGSQLVIANDSGPGHLAAAVGAPLVSVFGVTEPEKTQPWGPQVHRVGEFDRWPSVDEVLAAAEAKLRVAQ